MEDVQTINELDALVGRIFSIEDITLGSAKDKYLVRYRGRLYSEDSAAAYDHLAALLRPHAVTPLFRMEGDRQAILLVSGVVPPVQASNPWVNLGLFVLTLLSVLLTGGLSNLNGPLPPDLLPAAGMIVRQGWPFAVSMLGILGAHEFGHYLMGRYHGVHVSLPYFIPLPLVSPFGTMGAFINMKEPPKNRRVLLDIAIAGPLAGAAVAIPVLLIGLSLSALNRLPAADLPGLSLQLEGNSILYLLAKFLVFGAWLPAPVDYHGVAPLLYWGKYFLTGMPFPFGGTDVFLHPVAWAAWGGLLVTAINLIPAGQLDGGHVLYVLTGRRFAQRLLPFMLAGLVLLGVVWSGWWLWAVLVFFFGRVYAEPLDQITPLDKGRKRLAVLALVLFLVTFTPVPIVLV